MLTSQRMIFRRGWVIILTVFGCLMMMIPATYAAKIATVKPKLGTIQHSFTELAKTHLENIYNLNMPFDGKLTRIQLREGSTVKKGQVVAQLEQAPLIYTLHKAKAQLETYAAQYELQQKTAARQQKLFKKGYTDRATLDEAKSRLKVIQTQIAHARSDLHLTQYQLDESRLLSPINGTVLNRYTQGGKWLITGTPLLRIGNLKNLEVICDVLTQEAQQLHVGDQVKLSSIGQSIVLSGKIKQIYPAGFTKKSSLGVDEQRVNVIIQFAQPAKAAKLGLGYRLQAKFFVGSPTKKALIIPRFSVLQNPDGSYYVLVIRNKKLHKQVVKLGMQTDNQVSVINDLTQQDTIVTEPTTDMKDGMTV